MEKRHINRNRRLAAAAVAAMAVSGLAHTANATLTLEMTTDGNGPGTGKTATAVVNTPITLDVWATVTGTASLATDMANNYNQALQIAELSAIGVSTGAGSVVGNFALAAAPSPSAPWNASGSSSFNNGSGIVTPSGTFTDANGDTAIGSTNPADATGWYIARADNAQGVSGVSSTSFLLGKLTFTPTALNSGTETDLKVALRGTQDSALWFEDGTSAAGTGGGPNVYYNQKDGSSGTIIVGAAVAVSAAASGPANSEWTFNSNGGNWTLSSNWNGGTGPVPGSTVPGASGGDVAKFLSNGDTSGTRAVTLDANETLGGIVFGPTAGAGYTISGAHTITLNNGTPANPTITVNSGNSTISSQVTVAQNMTVAGSGGSVTLSNLNNPGGHAINMTGAGTLTLTGTQTHGSGASLNVSNGTVNINTDVGNNVTLNTTGTSTTVFGQGVAQFTVKDINVDLNANDLVIVPGGVPFQSELVAIQPTPGTDITRAEIEKIGTANEFGNLTGTTGITTAHAGFNPAVNAIQMAVQGDTLFEFETIIGDCNGDGITDSADISVASGFQDVSPGTGPAAGMSIETTLEGDWNGDFLVTAADIGIIAGNLNDPFNPSDGPPLKGVSAVPEPASLGLLGIGAVGLLRRRRKA